MAKQILYPEEVIVTTPDNDIYVICDDPIEQYTPLGTVPLTNSSPGIPGDMAADTEYAYFCVAEDTWVRMPLSGILEPGDDTDALFGVYVNLISGTYVEVAEVTELITDSSNVGIALISGEYFPVVYSAEVETEFSTVQVTLLSGAYTDVTVANEDAILDSTSTTTTLLSGEYLDVTVLGDSVQDDTGVSVGIISGEYIDVSIIGE